ncbi:hypothetical protein ZWY2020_038178 [Hordeum vulgare]|nr:hypothetical protein ZWY2020_038178 [Hordeum vulgare]
MPTRPSSIGAVVDGSLRVSAGGVGAVRCHQHPPAAAAAATKAREKAKGARKLHAADVALNHRLVSWRVGGGSEDGPAATGGYNYRGASTSAVLAHLADGNNLHAEDKEEDDADLVAAALREISHMYDLIVGLQAAPGGQEDDTDGTAAAADTDEIEEQDAEITDDVDEDEEEDDDGFCVVRGITIALVSPTGRRTGSWSDPNSSHSFANKTACNREYCVGGRFAIHLTLLSEEVLPDMNEGAEKLGCRYIHAQPAPRANYEGGRGTD